MTSYDPTFLDEFKSQITEYINKEKTRRRKKFLYVPTLFSNDSATDIANLKIAFEVRQRQMIEGDIGQIILGSAPGFINLKQGHVTKCDVMNEDGTILIEVKNKWNTCNSDSTSKVLDKLALYKRENPNAECIWGIINPKKIVEGFDETIIHHGVEIKKIQGLKLFSKIFTHSGNDYSQEAIKFVKEEISKY